MYRIVLANGADTNNAIYTALKEMPNVRIVQYTDIEKQHLDIQKGRIAGIVNIARAIDSSSAPYTINLKSTTSSNDSWPQLKSLLESTIDKVSDKYYKDRPVYASFNFDFKKDIAEIRQYKTIDFILPGQLGFSLLNLGVFGVAFTFFNLRNQLVLKRFFATPISKTHIILGEGLSRVMFQMIAAIVIIGAGYLFFGFTLIHGVWTFVQMLLLSFVGLLLFMGFGFIISGLATSDSFIPPFANLITMPQFLLGGTFFSIDIFPKWLQPISRALPLTHLNEAMRSVAFEGHNLWDVKGEIGYLMIWIVVVYAIATKVFKWE